MSHDVTVTLRRFSFHKPHKYFVEIGLWFLLVLVGASFILLTHELPARNEWLRPIVLGLAAAIVTPSLYMAWLSWVNYRWARKADGLGMKLTDTHVIFPLMVTESYMNNNAWKEEFFEDRNGSYYVPWSRISCWVTRSGRRKTSGHTMAAHCIYVDEFETGRGLMTPLEQMRKEWKEMISEGKIQLLDGTKQFFVSRRALEHDEEAILAKAREHLDDRVIER